MGSQKSTHFGFCRQFSIANRQMFYFPKVMQFPRYGYKVMFVGFLVVLNFVSQAFVSLSFYAITVFVNLNKSNTNIVSVRITICIRYMFVCLYHPLTKYQIIPLNPVLPSEFLSFFRIIKVLICTSGMATRNFHEINIWRNKRKIYKKQYFHGSYL